MAQVEIYGRAHLVVDKWSATGATAAAENMAGRMRVVDNASRIGFRINEDLGGGLRAFALIEGGINIDNPAEFDKGQSGLPNTGTGGFGTREAHLGIGNRMGEVRLGRQNVYWGNGLVEDVAPNHMTFAGVGVYSAASSGYVTAPVARQDNTIQFIANSDLAGAFAGSSVWISYPNSAERLGGTGAGTQNPPNPNNNAAPTAKAQGAMIRWAQGPWLFQFDNATSKNSMNSAEDPANRTNTGNKLGLAYTMGTTKLSVHWGKMEREYTLATSNSGALNTNIGGGSQSFTGFSVTHGMGSQSLYFQHAKLGKFQHATLGEQANTGSTSTAIGLRHNLSKRTHAYISYNVVKNESNAYVNMSGGGYSSSGKIGNGADQKSTAIGILHNF